MSASATAGLVIRDDSGNIILDQSAAGEYGIPLQLNVGEIYGISLTATANITDPHGEFTIQASSDPTFTLTGPDASEFQILYSPGVVPEPPACLMLITGLLGLGFGLFRRKAKLHLAR